MADVTLSRSILLQVQVTCDHFGRPIHVKGPLVPRHDSFLFQKYAPPLGPGEKVLCDTAYIKYDRLGIAICPFKRKPGARLNRLQRHFNRAQRWFRATVEHTYVVGSELLQRAYDALFVLLATGMGS